MTDLITVSGVAFLLAGLYLWLGLPAPLIALGIILLGVGVRLAQLEGTENEHNETTSTNEPEIFTGDG